MHEQEFWGSCKVVSKDRLCLYFIVVGSTRRKVVCEPFGVEKEKREIALYILPSPRVFYPVIFGDGYDVVNLSREKVYKKVNWSLDILFPHPILSSTSTMPLTNPLPLHVSVRKS